MKYVLLHDDRCPSAAFHYRITSDAAIAVLQNEAVTAQHPNCVDVCIVATDSPSAAQIDVLKQLLLGLKLRYPGIELGAHRQVRRSGIVCPGSAFPMRALQRWWNDALPDLRDAALEAIIDRQYRP